MGKNMTRRTTKGKYDINQSQLATIWAGISSKTTADFIQPFSHCANKSAHWNHNRLFISIFISVKPLSVIILRKVFQKLNTYLFPVERIGGREG
jgi:hypothetical protein